DECIDVPHANPRRGFDHRADLGLAGRRFGSIGRERIRVITEAADCDTRGSDQILDTLRIAAIEVVDVDVGHAGISALSAAFRPAHHLNTLVAFLFAGLQDLLERQLGQNGTYQAETDHVTRGSPSSAWPRSGTSGCRRS